VSRIGRQECFPTQFRDRHVKRSDERAAPPATSATSTPRHENYPKIRAASSAMRMSCNQTLSPLPKATAPGGFLSGGRFINWTERRLGTLSSATI
jgi:hypothetical protein